MTSRSPADEADAVVRAVLTDFTSRRHLGVVVDSPPGAGKSTLVVRSAIDLAAAGECVMVVAQTNAQADDLVARMTLRAPDVIIGRLCGQDHLAIARALHLSRSNVLVRDKFTDLGDALIIVAPAAKWDFVRDVRMPWAIIDEAYQMRSDMLLRLAPRFERALFVGDPGQLDPFTVIDNDRWTGLRWDPMQSAVAAMLRSNTHLPQHQLPYSWRLSTRAAPPVSDAFYPFTPFLPATTADQRRLEFSTRGLGGGAVDETLDVAARSGWALHELPARHTVRTDAEAVDATARLALRVLERGATAWSETETGGAPVTAERIAVGAAHRDQVDAVRERLRQTIGGDRITVDTANRLQGSEYDFVVVLHPLSGRRDATSFHLEAGRLCVLTSRHRQACVVVARAGIQALLDSHPSSEPMHIDVPAKFPDGWEANHAMLAHLEPFRVRAA